MILLELQAGDTISFDTYAWLRERWKGPLLILASSFAPPDVLRVYDNGADGYIPLPCNLRVLVARVEALLRRAQGKRNTT